MIRSRVVLGVAIWLATGVASAQVAAPSPTPLPPLAKGDAVPGFEAEGLDGVKRVVDYPKGGSTVLLFFLSSCPTCHKMIPLWNSAFERRPKGLTVWGVMLDQEPPGFFVVTPVSFPVLRAPAVTPEARRAFSDRFRITRVPVTLRVSPGGRVEDVGLGPLDPIRLGELFRP